MTLRCPRCAHDNRDTARFCARCGLALPAQAAPAMPRPATMKVCPGCGAQASLGAATCARCGYRFASGRAPAPARRRSRLWAWGVSLALVVVAAGAAAGAWRALARPADPTPAAVLPAAPEVAPPMTPSPAAAPTGVSPTPESLPARSLDSALRATVQLSSRSGDGRIMGSGSIVRSDGVILTNFHVVGDPESGRLYAAGGVVVALIEGDPSQPPQARYLAQVEEFDVELDLAVLRIVGDSRGRALRGDLSFDAMELGDSDSVRIGDALTVLGFPGIGGGTITLTRGTVSGFLPDWFKTDTEVNHGNSGGAALDQAGRLIGVPSAGNTSDEGELPGKIGLIRPINLARPLLDRLD